MNTKMIEKAVAVLIVIFFITSAFIPIVGSQREYSTSIVLEEKDNTKLNSEQELFDVSTSDSVVTDAHDVDDFLFLRDDSGGGSMPLGRRSGSFYDSVGREYKRPADYMELVSWYQNLEQNYSDYIDVFCDKGFFTLEDTERILTSGVKYGLRPKIHANELDYSGGIETGVKYNALSVDHLEFTGDYEIKTLLNSDTMPTLLPGAAFFLGMVYAPAKKMMKAGLPVALASDFNPGSSPSGNMQFILSLGCIKLKMTPEESINAVTINSAYAMGLSEELGSITIGKIANVFITKPIPSYQFMPYAYGSNKVESVILNGKLIKMH